MSLHSIFSQQMQTHQNIERTKATTKIMQPSEFIPQLASELNKTHHSRDTQMETQPKRQSLELDQSLLLCSENCESVTHHEAATLETVIPSADEDEVEVTEELCENPDQGLEEEEEEDINGRERLKRHGIEVAGRVLIPDIWGQEEMLKDWIDCSAFDASLVPTGIISARAALAQEGRRRATSGGLRI